jgi:hypothetical protein
MVDEEDSGDETAEAETQAEPAKRKYVRKTPEVESVAKKETAVVRQYSVSSLIGSQVEIRLTSTRDGDSLAVGTLAFMDEFFIYLDDGNETTAYNSAHMISIRSRRALPASKGREDFVKAGEDDVVQTSQDDIERQKAANKKRHEAMIKLQREKISSQKFG